MIAKLSGSSAEKYYYEKDPIFNSDGDGENLSWRGALSKSLSLTGKVDKDDFKSVLDGKTKDGKELRSLSQKTSGEERKAYDFVFSAPKSVSHAALVLDKKDIIKAHDNAVKTAMGYVESLAQARVYNEKGEREKQDTGKILYASANHSISRATSGNFSDPSLHTHNVIMNTTMTKDGKLMSLNVDKMYENQTLINQVYKETLANNLKNQGYDLTYDKKGNFEISGYSKDVLDNFSKRKNEIDSQVKLMKEDEKYVGKSDKELRDYAQHKFKSEKKDVSKEDLKKDWDRQHKENFITSKKDLENAIKEASENQKEKLSVDEILKIAATNLTDKESYFDKEKLLKEALKINQGDNSVKDIMNKIDSVKKTGQKEDWDLKKIEVNGKEFLTTKEIYEIEKENRKMLSKSEKSVALLSKDEATRGLDDFEKKMGWKMTETQRLAALNSLTTTDKFSAVQGDAGTGKTTFLDAVRHAIEYNNQNSENLGVLAPTGKAAVGASEESGIKSMTVDSYLMKGGFDDSQKSSFNKSENFNKIFEDKKFQVGGGLFGLAFNNNKQISTVSQNKHYDKMTQTYVHTKKETIKNGEHKGATKKSLFEINGDTITSKTDIKLPDGREMKAISKDWNMFRNLKTSQILSNKSSSFEQKNLDSITKINKNDFKIFGFSKKTESIKVYDKNGKLLETKAKSETTFMGKTIGKETKADEKNIHNRNYVKNGENVESIKTQFEKNSTSLKNVDKNLDKSLNKELNNSSDKKMIFVDESSMLSSKKLNSLLKDAEEKGHKIMFIGDTKQLSSVQQGKAFNEIQELTKTTHMNEGMRQQRADEQTKKVVDSFAKKDVETALKTLDEQGKFKEMSWDKQKDYIVDKITKNDDYKKTVVLVSTSKEANEINDKTREKIYGDKNYGTKTKVLEDKKLDLVEKMKIENYEIGDKVTMKSKDVSTGKEKYSNYTVKDVDSKKGNIILSPDKKDLSKESKDKEVSLRKEYGNISEVKKVVEKSFTEGDKVINLKNDKQKGVMNGEIGYVKKIDEKTGKMSVDYGKNKTVDYDLKNENKNLNHSYGMTTHKSQGITEEKAIAVLNKENSGMNKQNLAYVAASRHKKDFELLSNDKTTVSSQIKDEQIKVSTSDSKESKEDLKKEIQEYAKAKKEDVKASDNQDNKKEDVKASDNQDNKKEDVKASDNQESKKEDVKASDNQDNKKEEVKHSDNQDNKKEEVKHSDNQENKKEEVKHSDERKNIDTLTNSDNKKEKTEDSKVSDDNTKEDKKQSKKEEVILN